MLLMRQQIRIAGNFIQKPAEALEHRSMPFYKILFPVRKNVFRTVYQIPRKMIAKEVAGIGVCAIMPVRL